MKKIKKNKKNSEYLIEIIKQNPTICAGRRNYEYFYNSILFRKTLQLLEEVVCFVMKFNN